MIRTIGLTLLLLSTVYAVWLVQTPTAQRQGSNSEDLRKPREEGPLFIFRQIAPQLRRICRVPLRLPRFLPGVDKKHPIYAVLHSVNRSSYDIILGTEPDCNGGNVCLYGDLQGSASSFDAAPFDPTDGSPIPVTLRANIKGQFFDFVCGAHCSEAYVRWSEDGFYYSIGIKAETKETLVKVANSAIPAARRIVPK